MASLNLDLNFFDHPKTRRLTALLGSDAEVLVIRLWCYCGRHHFRDGKLAGYSAKEVESLCGWKGSAGKAVEGMIKTGFLDELGDEAGFIIHDWVEYQGHIAAFHDRAKKARKKQLDSLVSASSRLEAGNKPGSSPAKDDDKPATSTALTRQGNTRQGNTPLTPQRGDGPKISKEEKQAGELAREWVEGAWGCTRRSRTGGYDDSVPKISTAATELLRHVSFEEAMAELKNPARNRNEQFFHFSDRLLSRKSRAAIAEEDPHAKALRLYNERRREEEEDRKRLRADGERPQKSLVEIYDERRKVKDQTDDCATRTA